MRCGSCSRRSWPGKTTPPPRRIPAAPAPRHVPPGQSRCLAKTNTPTPARRQRWPTKGAVFSFRYSVDSAGIGTVAPGKPGFPLARPALHPFRFDSLAFSFSFCSTGFSFGCSQTIQVCGAQQTHRVCPGKKNGSWTRRELNPRSPPCEGGILPLDYEPVEQKR